MPPSPLRVVANLPVGTRATVRLARPDELEVLSRPYRRADGTIGREIVIRRVAPVPDAARPD